MYASSAKLSVSSSSTQLPGENDALLLDDDVPEPSPAEERGGGAQGTAGRARQRQQGHGGVK